MRITSPTPQRRERKLYWTRKSNKAAVWRRRRIEVVYIDSLSLVWLFNLLFLYFCLLESGFAIQSSFFLPFYISNIKAETHASHSIGPHKHDDMSKVISFVMMHADDDEIRDYEMVLSSFKTFFLYFLIHFDSTRSVSFLFFSVFFFLSDQTKMYYLFNICCKPWSLATEEEIKREIRGEEIISGDLLNKGHLWDKEP